jgi:hypothetical protein
LPIYLQLIFDMPKRPHERHFELVASIDLLSISILAYLVYQWNQQHRASDLHEFIDRKSQLAKRAQRTPRLEEPYSSHRIAPSRVELIGAWKLFNQTDIIILPSVQLLPRLFCSSTNWCHRLRALESATNCRIWPPIDLHEKMADTSSFMSHMNRIGLSGDTSNPALDAKDEDDEDHRRNNKDFPVQTELILGRVMLPSLIITAPVYDRIKNTPTFNLLTQQLHALDVAVSKRDLPVKVDQGSSVFRVRTLDGGKDLAAIKSTDDLQSFMKQAWRGEETKVRTVSERQAGD